MLDSESAVLGAVLLDASCLPLVRERIGLDDFQSEPGRTIFRAACALADGGEQIDPVFIKRRAERQGEVLADETLRQLMQLAAASVHDIPAHVGLMRESRRRSELLSAVSSAQARLMGPEPPDVIAFELAAVLDGATESADRPIGSADAMLGLMEYRVEVETGRARPCVPTGFAELDRLLGGGLIASGFIVLAARPGHGKTTMGLEIAERVAAAGIPVGFISLEMDVNQLSARRVAAETGLSATQILAGRLTEAECVRLAEGVDKLQGRPLHFNRQYRITVPEIEVFARQIKGCGLLVVDYLGLIQHEKGNSLYERVTATSNALKRLSRALKIPVLCLAQLNRANELRRDKTPMVSDLRDSGAIEQDADTVLLLYRHTVQEEDFIAPVPLTLTVAKNRHGPPDVSLDFNWYLRSGRIRPTHYSRTADY